MTNQEMRDYFKSLSLFLNTKHNGLMDLQPEHTSTWVDDILTALAKQLKRPTGLTLHSSSTAFEKEFHTFLKIWKSAVIDDKKPYTSEDHYRLKALAGVYLRQLSRLYKEIGK